MSSLKGLNEIKNYFKDTPLCIWIEWILENPLSDHWRINPVGNQETTCCITELNHLPLISFANYPMYIPYAFLLKHLQLLIVESIRHPSTKTDIDQRFYNTLEMILNETRPSVNVSLILSFPEEYKGEPTLGCIEKY